MRTRTGFSLVELMIVVAIIGILAAIAVPNFIAMQLKAKRAELPANVEGIQTSQVAAFSGLDTYITVTPNPPGTPGKTFRPWATDADWNQLGWKPDGQVRGSYAAEDMGTDFKVVASSDVDGDGDYAIYSATSSVNATLASGDNEVY